MDTLPPFTDQGLVLGQPEGTPWDGQWRQKLVDNLTIMVDHLRQVGITEIFIDGSFVEEKPHPNDIDGYFLCDPEFLYDGHLESALQELDPVWTWDPARRSISADSPKRQLPMWHKYRVELFPHVGQGTGVLDQYGNELEFPAAFRQSRSFKPKGIVKIGGLS